MAWDCSMARPCSTRTRSKAAAPYTDSTRNKHQGLDGSALKSSKFIRDSSCDDVNYEDHLILDDDPAAIQTRSDSAVFEAA